MLRSSIAIGRFMNVDLRVHVSFLLLLILSVASLPRLKTGAAASRSGSRCAPPSSCAKSPAPSPPPTSAFACAHSSPPHRRPHGLLHLHHDATRTNTRLLMLTGPIANFGVGLLLLGTSYALEPHVSLLASPGLPPHILRSSSGCRSFSALSAFCPPPRHAHAPHPPPTPSRPSPVLRAHHSLVFGLGTGLASPSSSPASSSPISGSSSSAAS